MKARHSSEHLQKSFQEVSSSSDRYFFPPCTARAPSLSSMIRKAMVSTMFGTGGQAPSFGGFQGEENALVSMRGGGGEAAKGAAAACMLWSTVTLGYLVRGRPRESVGDLSI